jgi:hypothetical protein
LRETVQLNLIQHGTYFRAAKIEVFIGGVNRLALEPNEQYFKTLKYKVHENYQPSTLANDIALAFLEKDVQISIAIVL